MLYNKDILFIHIGKTGGSSATKYLCKVLNKPVYNVIPVIENAMQFGNETIKKGRRHATLSEAVDYLKEININIDSFKKIIAVIRNPYSYEVSLFNYYLWLYKSRQSHFKNFSPLRKEIIKIGNFEKFIETSFNHRPNLNIKDYVILDGEFPKNLEIIKFENMKENFLNIGKDFGNPKIEFPHLNKMTPVDYREFISNEKIEEFIYNKHKWVFEIGEYDRIKF